MYLCEICGTCSKPRTPCLRRWGHLGYYREIKVCSKCHAALVDGKTVRELRGYQPLRSVETKLALPNTARRI